MSYKWPLLSSPSPLDNEGDKIILTHIKLVLVFLMFILWKKRNKRSVFIHSAMQSHRTGGNSIYGGVLWWYNFICCKMVASLENNQGNVKNQAALPIWYVQKKSSENSSESHFAYFYPLYLWFCVLFTFYTMSLILLSPYHNVLKCSCFMVRWKAGTNFPLLFLVSVCSLESAKPSSFQQCWLIQFPCIFFSMYELITDMQKVSSLKQRILPVSFNSFLHFASKWQNCCWCIAL